LQLGHDPKRQTNIKLIRLLKEHFGLSLHEIYATNLFPFIKLGGMSAALPSKDMLRAAEEFALPQLEIIQPKIAICLGIETFNALRRACGLKKTGKLEEAVNNPFLYQETMVWCQAHTSPCGQNTRNRSGKTKVSEDWAAMADYFRTRS
ncbi:MAG TPA: uracil-DNA glycosylase family protein, partial [Leptolyngbyaceae cyanobacterium]